MRQLGDYSSVQQDLIRANRGKLRDAKSSV